MKFLWSLALASTCILCSYQLVFAIEPTDFDPAIPYYIQSQPVESQPFSSQYAIPEAGASGTPVQMVPVLVESSWVGNLWQTVRANVSYTVQELTHVVSELENSIKHAFIQYTPAAIRPFVVLSLAAVPTLAVLVWRSETFAPIRAVSFVLSSLSDLVMHVVSGVAAGIQSITSPVRFINAYRANKSWIKTNLKRDIGNGWQDLFVGALVGGVVALVLIGPEVVAASGSFITTATPTYLAVKGPDIMNETTRECMNPMQCSTPIDFLITLGVNVVTATLPDFEVDQGLIALKNKAFSFMKVGDDVADETSTVIRTAGNTVHAVAINFTREDLERRVGREFVQEIFGDATGAEFDQIARKWPNALEKLYEGEKKGHVLVKHVEKTDEFLKNRAIEEEAVSRSTFISKKSMLDAVESSISDNKNAVEIQKWLSDTQDRSVLRLTHENQNEIGRVFNSLENNIYSTKKSLVFLKKENNNYYILTAYAE